VVGSLAIVTESDRGGVSLIIESHYHRPMPGGQVVEIEAEVSWSNPTPSSLPKLITIYGSCNLQGTIFELSIPPVMVLSMVHQFKCLFLS
jgi:hypothetical protein